MRRRRRGPLIGSSGSTARPSSIRIGGSTRSTCPRRGDAGCCLQRPDPKRLSYLAVPFDPLAAEVPEPPLRGVVPLPDGAVPVPAPVWKEPVRTLLRPAALACRSATASLIGVFG